MAEAIAKKNASDVMEASSAGLTPLGSVIEETVTTLVRNGYSTEGLASKRTSNEALASADLIINMSGLSHYLAFPECTNVEDWEVEDPYGEDAETYQRILQEIETRVGKLAERLRKQVANPKERH